MSRHESPESSVNAGRLRYDHRSFERRLAEMCDRASRGGWAPLASAWVAFGTDVVRHLAFEELSVFPAFAQAKPGQAALVGRLLDQHDHLRHLLDVLGTAFALGRDTTLLLEGFCASMGEHQELENLRVDPWLELQDRRGDPSHDFGR